jgi:hypothetical protein
VRGIGLPRGKIRRRRPPARAGRRAAARRRPRGTAAVAACRCGCRRAGYLRGLGPASANWASRPQPAGPPAGPWGAASERAPAAAALPPRSPAASASTAKKRIVAVLILWAVRPEGPGGTAVAGRAGRREGGHAARAGRWGSCAHAGRAWLASVRGEGGESAMRKNVRFDVWRVGGVVRRATPAAPAGLLDPAPQAVDANQID